MVVSEREALSARMSAYAFLAGLVLAKTRRMARKADAVLDADDLVQIELLRDVLLASWRGAELSGNLHYARPDAIGDLVPDPRSGVSTVSEQLQAYRLVKKLAPGDFEDFVPRAALVLDRLHDERVTWPTLDDADKTFVSHQLDQFLDRLTRGDELVSEAFVGAHSTLA